MHMPVSLSDPGAGWRLAKKLTGPPSIYRPPFDASRLHSLPHATEAELQEMIDRADQDQDGEISFEEFYSIMTKKTFA